MHNKSKRDLLDNFPTSLYEHAGAARWNAEHGPGGFSDIDWEEAQNSAIATLQKPAAERSFF